jgi:peptidase E
MAQQIVAISGMSYDNINMMRYILNLSGKERPKVCFLPQATAESSDYIIGFYDAFTKFGAEPSWQSLFGRVPRNWKEHILAQDIIYVGGGNTKSMVALWRDWGMDEVLKEALNNGTILSGVSAGAICWFEQCVTDSVWPLGAIQGLGWLKGSACPHYDGEPERRPTVLQMVKDGEIIPGIAMQDHAAAHYIDGELHKIVVTQAETQAFHVSIKDGEAHEAALAVEFIGEI